VATSLGALIWWPPQQLIYIFSGKQDNVCIGDVENWLINFFTNTDSSDPSTFIFWFEFIFICDYYTSTHCDTGTIVGTGIWYGALWFYGALIVVSIVLLIFGVPDTLLLFLWMYSIFFTFSVAYGYCPLCFPMLPNCLANDVYWYFFQISVPCINWTGIFGNAVAGQCSLNVEQCFNQSSLIYTPLPAGGVCPVGQIEFGPNERYFPNCTAAPYNFNSPLKPLFFLTEWIWPGFNNWLRNTQSPTLKYLRDISVVQNSLDFAPFPSGGPTRDQTACFFIAGLSTLGYVVLYSVGFILIGFLFYVLIQLIIWSVLFVVTLIITLVSPLVEFSTSAKNGQPRQYTGALSGGPTSISSSQTTSLVSGSRRVRTGFEEDADQQVFSSQTMARARAMINLISFKPEATSIHSFTSGGGSNNGNKKID
jgi:hypothetical protein